MLLLPMPPLILEDLDAAVAAGATHDIKMMTQFLMCTTLMTLQMRWRSLTIISSHLKIM